jgi:hypothetical protein
MAGWSLRLKLLPICGERTRKVAVFIQTPSVMFQTSLVETRNGKSFFREVWSRDKGPVFVKSILHHCGPGECYPAVYTGDSRFSAFRFSGLVTALTARRVRLCPYTTDSAWYTLCPINLRVN